MRISEFLAEDNANRVYDWTKPVVVLRGSQRGETDPFKDIRLGAPFFTDSPTVAGGYSKPWRKGESSEIKGRVFRYQVKLNNPCILWHGEPEMIVEIGTLRERLNLDDAETLALYHHFEQFWNNKADDETVLRTSKMPFDEITEDIGMSAFWVASDTSVQNRAKAAGYDGFILRGPYTGEGHGAEEGNTSFDGVTALEWVAFNPSSVKLLDPVPEETVDEALSPDDDLDVQEDEPITPAETFLHRFYQLSDPHPFNHRARLVGGAVIELSRSVEDRDAGIHISDIMTVQPGKGFANAAMANICELADATRVTLDLTAKAYLTGDQAKGKMNTKQLVKWYNKFGFVYVSGDPHDGVDMKRTPPMRIKLRGFNNRPH